MLNPTVGRWMEEDPDGFAAGNADLYGYVSNDPMNFTDPSGLIEVDDNPKNPMIAKLPNSDAIIQAIVATAVKAAKKKFPNDPVKGTAEVYQQLGVSVGFAKLLSGFESKLNDALAKQPGKSYQIPFNESRYGKVPFKPLPVAIASGTPQQRTDYCNQQVPLMFASKLTIGSSFAPVIRVSGVAMGTDKWGHFFQQGYWYYMIFSEPGLGMKRKITGTYEDRLNYGKYLEGDPEFTGNAKNNKLIEKFTAATKPFDPKPLFVVGRFGWPASGVVSYADMAANELGFWFYVNLYNSWGTLDPDKYQFDIGSLFKQVAAQVKEETGGKVDADWLKMLNEYENPNKFHPYIANNGVSGPVRK